MLISTGGGERGGVGASEPFGVPFGVALGVPFGAFPAFAGGFFLRAMAGRLCSANLAGSAKAVQATSSAQQRLRGFDQQKGSYLF